MNKIEGKKIAKDYFIGGLSFRSLAFKYGISCTQAHWIVKSQKPIYPEKPTEEELPDDVAMLKAMLRRERLKNELLNNIIDIADKELGTNIRKKSGTRRSE